MSRRLESAYMDVATKSHDPGVVCRGVSECKKCVKKKVGHRCEDWCTPDKDRCRWPRHLAPKLLGGTQCHDYFKEIDTCMCTHLNPRPNWCNK